MKKLVLIALCSLVIVSGVFAQGGGEKATKSGPYLIKLANTQGEKDTQSIGLKEAKERLEATGLFKVELYYSSSLGGTDDLTEQAIAGAPVLTVSDPGRLMTYVKDFGVIQMPFMFDDASALNKLVETATYKGWEQEFEKQGIKLVTSNWYSGARNFVLNKEVNVPADLKGQKIRTIGSPLYTESVNAMGAIATPMEWAEVYPALSQGAIDGVEAQTPSVYATRLFETSKYINKTEHFQLIGCVVMGSSVFNSWSKEAQDVFVKTFKEVGKENQGLVMELTAEYEAEMAKSGMIIRTVDKTPFLNAVQPVYEKLGYSKARTSILAEIAK
ncbi:C4-dicarboxylate TRAP transporter substrate-binding protein [Sphaerochaeta sp. PS]|uniref:C4-dicarboxylate TRAP transporter substrate-binding protein n=1 Tax=Sphaerochaeta sp. PS TaxID=3076336 RepID=UPI0028A2FF36|nr:C4-dicarboxylate TRAP transporter substrate-binding protein [Sphaerochaeta sp. PS]MDT4763197.1 C4-dicarboxylate TRAP transporter substrate-binding protein [Sphaerochaeta sp. PS]